MDEGSEPSTEAKEALMFIDLCRDSVINVVIIELGIRSVLTITCVDFSSFVSQ